MGVALCRPADRGVTGVNESLYAVDWGLITAIGAAGGALGIAVFVLSYHLNSRRRRGIEIEGVEASRYLASEMAQVWSAIKRLEASEGQPGRGASAVTEELVRAHLPSITEEVADRVRGSLASEVVEWERVEQVRKTIALASSRLSLEMELLRSRASSNLAFGSIATAFAIGLLAYMAFSVNTSTSLTEMATMQLPKLSLAIFIEVFAFFFLKLYKANLAEIRLYHLDLSQLASLGAAVELAWAADETNALGSFARDLLGRKVDVGDVGAATCSTEGQVDPKLIADLAASIAKIVTAHNK